MSKIGIALENLYDEDWETQCAKGYSDIPKGAEVKIKGYTTNLYGHYIKVIYNGILYYVKPSKIEIKGE